jgi:hypothetical protein
MYSLVKRVNEARRPCPLVLSLSKDAVCPSCFDGLTMSGAALDVTHPHR